MIFDIHTHTPQYRDTVPPEKRTVNTTWRPDTARNSNFSWAEYRESQSAVDKSIVFGIAWEPGERVGGSNGPRDHGDVAEKANDFTANFVHAYPDELIGFMCVHPYDVDAMDEMERSRVDLGLRGVKLGANYQAYDPLDRRALAVYNYAERHGLPIMFHTGTSAVKSAPIPAAHPLTIDEIASRYPELRIVMAHMGHPWTADTTVVVRKHAHVYTDISGLFYRPFTHYEALIRATEWNILDKVLFGSDFPVTTPTETMAGLRGVNDIVEGTRMPRVPLDKIEEIIHRDSLALLGLE